jgi:AcrR family transcriptional regulator
LIETATATRRRLTSDERRADLLEAAKRVLASGGWDALSMVSVADESGVTKRIVYNHFANPQEIIEALIASPLAEITAQARVLSDLFVGRASSPLEILNASLDLSTKISSDGWFVLRAVYSRQLPLEFKPIENYAGQLIMELWGTVFERSALDEKQKIDIMFFIYGAVLDMAKLDRGGELSEAQREEMFDRILGLLGLLELS